jgi:serine protease Do
VQVQPVTADIADSLGMKIAEGALVDEPQPNSPAAKARIHAGDVITAVNGTAVKDACDLAGRIGMMAPGSPIKLDILHKGTTKTVTLALGQMPNERQARANGGHIGPATGAPYLGLTLAPANDMDGFSGKGVAILGVVPDGPAADHGLRTGDVILDVGGKAATKVDDVRKALIEAKAEGKHHVLMRVKTADATKFVACRSATDNRTVQARKHALVYRSQKWRADSEIGRRTRRPATFNSVRPREREELRRRR